MLGKVAKFGGSSLADADAIRQAERAIYDEFFAEPVVGRALGLVD